MRRLLTALITALILCGAYLPGCNPDDGGCDHLWQTDCGQNDPPGG